jgi:hypothetical protein
MKHKTMGIHAESWNKLTRLAKRLKYKKSTLMDRIVALPLARLLNEQDTKTHTKTARR